MPNSLSCGAKNRCAMYPDIFCHNYCSFPFWNKAMESVDLLELTEHMKKESDNVQ